jgi:hypothetical protein
MQCCSAARPYVCACACWEEVTSKWQAHTPHFTPMAGNRLLSNIAGGALRDLFLSRFIGTKLKWRRDA